MNRLLTKLFAHPKGATPAEEMRIAERRFAWGVVIFAAAPVVLLAVMKACQW